jgi:hypothetical protein
MIRVLPADDEAMIRAGIRAILTTADDIEVVAEAAHGHQAIAEGGAYLSPTIARRVITHLGTRQFGKQAIAHVQELTAREREVLALVGTGLSNAEIARRPACRRRHGQGVRQPDPHPPRPQEPSTSRGPRIRGRSLVPEEESTLSSEEPVHGQRQS